MIEESIDLQRENKRVYDAELSSKEIGSDLCAYFVAIARDAKSTDMYFSNMKLLGFEKTIHLMAKSFCESQGIKNKQFVQIIERFLREV